MKKKKTLTFLIILLISASLFAEPYTYEDLLSIMNVNNLELLTQDEVIKTASIDVKDAKGNYSPSIDLTLSGTYMVNPLIDRITVSTDDILGPLAQQMGVPNNYVTLYDGMENTLYMAQLSITQPIFTWGKITNAVKLYNKILEIRQTEKEDKIDSLSVELEGSLGGLYYARAILEQLRLAAEDADSLTEIAKSGYENGVMLLDDYNVARLSKSELDMAVTEVEVQISSLMDSLEKTVGIELGDDDYSFIPDEEHYYEVSNLNRDELRTRAVSNANNNINSNEESAGFSIVLGEYYNAQVSVGNFTDGNLTMAECPINQIYLPVDLEESNEILTFAFPLTMTEDELQANAGEPTDTSHYEGDDNYVKNDYEYTVESERYYGDSGYKFEFTNGELSYVTIDWLP